MVHTICGLDVLKASPQSWLKRARLGVLFNQTSITAQYELISDVMNALFPGAVKALFSPQHGLYGTEQANMVETAAGFDKTLQVPIFSLYSDVRAPTEEMFELIDILVVDLQDVGCRVYTYLSTLYECMCCASQQGKPIIILDRPNPINGVDIEGPVLKQGFESFVGIGSLALRHGFTLAEATLYLNETQKMGCDITIVPMRGWERGMFYEDTGLPWIMPSPNLPTPVSCVVYPGQVLFEGTNISEGRGTTRPFEIFGAPFIEPQEFLKELSEATLSGCTLRSTFFKPTFDKWAGNVCGGCQIHVLDRKQYRPVFTAICILSAIYKLYNGRGFEWRLPPYEYEQEKPPLDIICGTDQIRLGIENNLTPYEIVSLFNRDMELFDEKRVNALIY